jgi:hypothetical protein
MKLNNKEMEVIEKVKEGIESDNKKSPWNSDKWYKTFTKNNGDGITLEEAPLNVPLMVVTESLGTLYRHNRGNAIMRGSVLIKTSNNQVECIDSNSWGATSSGASVYDNNGTFELSEAVYGKVKEVINVNI